MTTATRSSTESHDSQFLFLQKLEPRSRSLFLYGIVHPLTNKWLGEHRTKFPILVWAVTVIVFAIPYWNGAGIDRAAALSGESLTNPSGTWSIELMLAEARPVCEHSVGKSGACPPQLPHNHWSANHFHGGFFENCHSPRTKIGNFVRGSPHPSGVGAGVDNVPPVTLMVIQRGTWLFSRFPERHWHGALVLIESFRIFSRLAIFVDFKFAAKFAFLILHSALLWEILGSAKMVYMSTSRAVLKYGVASISRLLKSIGLFCKRAL